VIHVEVFNRSVSLVASDPEGLDTFIPAPPRRPDQRSSTLKSEEPQNQSIHDVYVVYGPNAKPWAA
jgi:hypothetical protein